MDIIRIDGQSGIVDSRVKIFINAESVPPQEPSQLPATEMEKQSIQERLVELASQIEGFLRGKFWLSMPEAMALSGITDARAAHAGCRHPHRCRWPAGSPTAVSGPRATGCPADQGPSPVALVAETATGNCAARSFRISAASARVSGAPLYFPPSTW